MDVRASLDDLGGKDKEMGAVVMEAGRVILAIPDISMVEFFRQQFAALPSPVEMVPALGADNTLALVQQVRRGHRHNGTTIWDGCDCCTLLLLFIQHSCLQMHIYIYTVVGKLLNTLTPSLSYASHPCHVHASLISN